MAKPIKDKDITQINAAARRAIAKHKIEEALEHVRSLYVMDADVLTNADDYLAARSFAEQSLRDLRSKLLHPHE